MAFFVDLCLNFKSSFMSKNTIVKKSLFLSLLFIAYTTIISAQTIRYVSQLGAGTKNGTSWTNAYDGTHLQNAINEVNTLGGGQVWVTIGTYYPTLDENGNTSPVDVRMKTFTLKNKVAIYGGFAGTETSLSSRAKSNYSFLSGDIGVLGDNSDNSYNVVYSYNNDSTAILDYFDIAKGNANGNSVIERTFSGGGVYMNGANLNLCYIEGNNAKNRAGGVYIRNTGIVHNSVIAGNTSETGGGAYLYYGGTIQDCSIYYNTANCTAGAVSIESNGLLKNCTIQYNSANGTSTIDNYAEGGAIYAYGAGALITGCYIKGNTCTSTKGGSYGGAIICYNAVKISNCTILENTCTYGNGGGIYSLGCKIENSKIYNNSASNGGGIYSKNSKICNSLINNNTSKYDGGGIFADDNGTTITNATVTNNLSNTNSTPAGIQLYVYSTSPGSCNLINSVFISSTSPATKYSFPVTFTVNQTNCANANMVLCGISCANFKKPTSFSGISTSTAQLNEINNADWRLSSTSPLVNNGTADTTGLSISSVDVAGNPRISINRIDIGAYEFQSIRYVTLAGAGDKSGSNWANAYPGDSLQYAINLGIGEVRVAAGTYKPKYDMYGSLSNAAPRKKVFNIAPKAVIYGGFAGNETDPSQRVKTDIDGNGKIENWEFQNPTILSGDIGVIGDSTDNCENVVTITNTSSNPSDSAIVDGVTITSSSQVAVLISKPYSVDMIKNCIITHSVGGAELMDSATLVQCLVTKNKADHGAGIYFNTGGIVDYCKVDGNYGATNGAGVYFDNGGEIKHSTISNNTGYAGGGGYISKYGLINNCILIGNSASGSGTPQGGGLLISGNGIVSNSFIVNNTSSGYNGGIQVNNAGIINNCVIANNTANAGAGGISMGGEESKLVNSVVSNNSFPDLELQGLSNVSKIVNSIITGGSSISGSKIVVSNNAMYSYSGGSNTITINSVSDVKFVHPTSFIGAASNASQLTEIQNADWSLLPESPCVNAGGNTIYWTDTYIMDVKTDINNKNRFALDDIVDIGAYELQDIKIPQSVSSISVQNTGVGTIQVESAKTNCDGYLVMVKEGSTGNNNLKNGLELTADSIFSNGSVWNTSWYTVSKGLSNAISVSGLTPGNWYRIAVNPYNGINYKVYSPSVDGQNVVKFYAKQPQDITFNAPSKVDGQQSYIPDVLASSNLKVDLISSDSSIARPNGNTLLILKPGTVTITAIQIGNNQYFAASSVSKTIVFGKALQTIDFAMSTIATFGDADVALNATTTSGLPIQYTTSDNNIATISNGWLSIKAAGTVTISATQSGNNYFTAATPVSYILTVNKASQKMSFGTLASKTFGDASFAITANATSGLPISFVSMNTAILSLAGNIATINGGGTCTIKAYQVGNNNNLPSDTISQSIIIGKKVQSITMDSISPLIYGVSDFAPTVKTESDSAFTLTSNNNSVVTILNGKIQIVGVETAIITATQKGTANYLPTSVNRVLKVTKAPQTITFATLGLKTVSDTSFVLQAFSNSGLPISYSTNSTNAVLLKGDTVVIKYAGKVSIIASQLGNDKYEAANPVTNVLTILPADQSIVFDALDTITFGSVSEIAPTVSSTSGLPVSLTSFNLSVAKIVNGKIVIVGAGSTVISASQNGNLNYNQAAPVKQVLVVNEQLQTLKISPISSLVYGMTNVEVKAEASSKLPISISTSSPNIIQIVNNKLNVIGTGLAFIHVSQKGTSGIAAIDSVIQINVTKANQTIAFPSIPIKKVGTIPFKLFATSNSGYPVMYKSSNPDVADVVENEVTIVGTGACKITAYVDESEFYFAGDSIQTLIVTALNTLKMPMYTINRDTVINLNDLVLSTDTFKYSFVSGKKIKATVKDSLAHIIINNNNKAWIGTDTLWFTAVNKNVVGDVQILGIKIRRRPLAEQIAMVTVDSATATKCIVAWERSLHAGIKGYIIYRGGIEKNKWDSIGYVSADSSSYFVDKAVNVKQQAYQYMLVTVDSNNVHSAPSSVHTTMHLLSGLNNEKQIQLWWTPYVGADVKSYIIYRLNQATGVYDSIGSSSLVSFTDIYTPTGKLSYKVGIRFAKKVRTDSFKSDSGPFSQSLSNMAESELVGTEIEGKSIISVYPNPAQTDINISDVQNSKITILNVLGQKVTELVNSQNENTVNISIENLPAGVYSIRVLTGDSVNVTQFVKE